MVNSRATTSPTRTTLRCVTADDALSNIWILDSSSKSVLAQNGGLVEKFTDVQLSTIQHLLDEIVHDEAVVARRCGNETGDVSMISQRQRCELKAGSSSFCAVPQCGHLVSGERQPQVFDEESNRVSMRWHVDELEVIQHQNQIAGDSVHLIDQGSQCCIN